MKSELMTLAVIVMASSLAFAQTERDPSSGKDMTTSSSTDATFMKKLAEGDLAEVDAGRLASQRSSNTGVKDFGQQMVTDHNQNDTELATLAAAHGVEVPTTIDSEHASLKATLENANGSAFDSQYIKAQVRDHEKTVALLQQEVHAGQDPAVKEFAQKTLPVVNHHLAMAKQLQAKLPDSAAANASKP